MRRIIRKVKFTQLALLLGAALGALVLVITSKAHAQVPGRPTPGLGQAIDAKGGKDAQETFILVLPKDSTRQVEMSTKELIAEFRSENPRIVRVQALLDNPRAVLVTGIGAGSTRVYITDVKKNVESLEIRVPFDEEADREVKRRELLEQVHRAVPTAVIDVQASANNTIVLTGTVPLAESVQVIMELTRGVFGPATNIYPYMRIGGVQHVQIEVTVARVNRSKARNIGFSFLQTGQQHFIASVPAGGGALTATSTLPSVLAPAATLAATPNSVFGIFNDKEGFFGYLTALTVEGLAKLISEPRVITQSGRPAWIVSGGETPILTTSGTGAPSVSYKMFGTIVSCLPIVLGNGKIHLEVRPEISNINAAAGISLPSAVGTTTVPGFDIRTAQVTVEMEDGQTLAIGGLIQNSINGQNSKVPILGDIPVLGFAFSNKTYTESEEEFIILVTPHLVDPMACTQLPKYLPGRETRTPDDFELFLEGILEAPRGQRYLHPYTAAYMNGPSAAVYPCGNMLNYGAGSGIQGCGPQGCGPQGCGPQVVSAMPSTIPGPVTSAATSPAQKSDARINGDTVTEQVPSGISPLPSTLPSTPPANVAPAIQGPTSAAPPSVPRTNITPTSGTPFSMPVSNPMPANLPPTTVIPPATTPSTLPALPPVTAPAPEAPLAPAIFGPAVLTDR